MQTKTQEEYFWLVDKLFQTDCAIEGTCDDIDCDKYVFRESLKKKFRPILEHNFSCIPKLKRDKAIVLRLLSQVKFKKFRYKKCEVCNKELDELSDDTQSIHCSRPCIDNKEFYDINFVLMHKKCRKKFKIPKGWN